MVLYSVTTTYHLLEAITHKLRYNKEKQSVLFISQWLVSKYPWYKKMTCIFDKVEVFNGHYEYSDTIKERLNIYFNSLLADTKVNIRACDEVHIFGAEHAFGAYLFLNEIDCYFWEEGAGALSKKNSMLELFEKAHGPEKAQFQCKMHLGDGEQPFVRARFYNSYYQFGAVDGTNLCHFDLGEELTYLDDTSRNLILDLFYGSNKISVKEQSALLLTECFSNISIMRWEEQILLYKYLTDYFLSGYKLIIKPHPDDLMYYEYLFKDSKVIRTKFPAELLPFIFDGKPSVVATSSSTSIYGLRKLYDKVMEFNFRFSHNKQFYSLNRYFAALSIADTYVREGYQLKLLGVNPAFVDNFNTFHGLCKAEYVDCGNQAQALQHVDSNPSVWIIDEIKNPHNEANYVCTFLNNLNDKDIVIFVNSDNSYCFYDYPHKDLWKWLHPVEVKQTVCNHTQEMISIAGPSLVNNQTEMIYVFKKGEKVDIYSVKRDLPNVGATVTSTGFDAQEEKVKILEGMLEATEKRLLYFIGREKELMKELEESKK